MQEVAIKTHLIVTDVHEEYDIDWCGRLMDTNPVFENDMPIFILISETHRRELNTMDMHRIEECAKAIAEPHGRAAVTVAKTHIYIKEEDNKQTLVGVVTHKHIKSYAPMYDSVYYK